MFTTVASIKTLKYTFKKQERLKGVYHSGEQNVKYHKSPFKIYLYIQAPQQGAEVLFIDGENDNKALVNPNAFPYVSVNLDPYGQNMRKNNHHTIYEVGFDYISNLLSHEFKQVGESGMKNEGLFTFNKRECYKITYENTGFKYIPYVMKQNENITQLAKKNYISEYMIMEKNTFIGDYNYCSPGKTIYIPNSYAKKTEIYIDKILKLPILQKIYDDKGLFEQYEYLDVQLNPVISEEEFTEDYDDYDF